MSIAKTGEFLARLYVGTASLLWGTVLIIGGGALVYIGMEPLRTRGFIMMGVGALILLFSVARFGLVESAKKKATPAEEPRFDADAAIQRYLAEKASRPPEPSMASENPLTSLDAPPKRPVFGRRGTA